VEFDNLIDNWFRELPFGGSTQLP